MAPDTFGKVHRVASPVRLSATPVSYRRAPPVLGADAGVIPGELALSREELHNLRETDVILSFEFRSRGWHQTLFEILVVALPTSPTHHKTAQADAPHTDGNNEGSVCSTLPVPRAAHHRNT